MLSLNLSLAFALALSIFPHVIGSTQVLHVGMALGAAPLHHRRVCGGCRYTGDRHHHHHRCPIVCADLSVTTAAYETCLLGEDLILYCKMLFL
jgi:hypothetical protein